MNIGYSFWGHLTDLKYNNEGVLESTPDGNASYSWTLINALTDRGHKIYRMMPNRDEWYVNNFGRDAFKAFATNDRFRAYRSLINIEYEVEYPELDVLILEWRWIGDSYDYKIQKRLLDNYCNTKTKIVIFDLDYKFDDVDYNIVKPHAILDCGYKHKNKGTFIHVNIPFDFTHMFDNEFVLPKRDLIYIGNRYERDIYIDKYIMPLSSSGISVKFFGNWLEKDRDSHLKWPTIDFGPRLNIKDFYKEYSASNVTILLAKEEYFKYSFMTMRILESIYFNCCPIGLCEFANIHDFLPDELIVKNIYDIISVLSRFRNLNLRSHAINELKSKLSFMDARYFVKTLIDAL